MRKQQVIGLIASVFAGAIVIPSSMLAIRVSSGRAQGVDMTNRNGQRTSNDIPTQGRFLLALVAGHTGLLVLSNPTRTKVRTVTAPIVIAMLGLCALSISAESGQTSKSSSSQEILNRKAVTTSNDRTTNALTTALSTAGVPGGIATVTGCGEDVRYAFPSSGPTLRDALNAIVASNPQYAWRLENGLVNVSPRSGDPLFLARHISQLKVSEARSLDEALSEILALPKVQRRVVQLHMSEGYRRIGMSDLNRPGSPRITNEQRYSISLSNVTLREALNAIARLHGRAVWEYRERHCNDKTEFQIQFLVR